MGMTGMGTGMGLDTKIAIPIRTRGTPTRVPAGYTHTHGHHYTEWEEEKNLAKQEKRRSQLKKPVRGPLPKAVPKPKMADFDSSGEEFEQEGPDSTESDDE